MPPRAAVRQLIEVALDEFLPRVCNKTLFEQKCERVYQHYMIQTPSRVAAYTEKKG